MRYIVLIVSISLLVILVGLVVAAEIILYLTSNGHANLDFVIKDSKKSDSEKLRDELRKQDWAWLQQQNTKEYFIESADGFKLRALYLPAPKNAKTAPAGELLSGTGDNDGSMFSSGVGDNDGSKFSSGVGDNGTSDKMAFCIHGIQSNGTREFVTAARYFYEHGISSFIIDQRACGKSEGKYVTYGLKEAEDCKSWLDFVAKEFGSDMRVFIYGMSMGSSITVLLGGEQLPLNVEYLVADCGYSSVKKQMYNTFASLKFPAGLFYFLYRSACLCHRIYDPNKVYITQAASRCTLPILFIHGDADAVVPVENINELYNACGSKDKKLLVTKGVGHVQSFTTSMEIREAIIERIQ